MGFDFNFGFGGSDKRDALVFQVAETFVEVFALRAVEDVDTTNEECEMDVLYSKRLPRAAPDGASGQPQMPAGQAGSLNLAEKVESLANEVMVSKEILAANFNIGEVRIVCIYAEPLSVKADTTYAAQLKEEKKVTTKLLGTVLSKGEVTIDELANVPQDYAVYNDTIESVRLNGYKTQRPLGKYSKRIELTVSKSLTTPAVWASVGTVLERTFNRELIYIHTDMPLDIDDVELCSRIYTGNELQTIAHDIL